MRRRSFFGLLGGVAAWPLAARAEQVGAVRRIGVLMGYSVSDPFGQARFKSFVRSLQELGWTEGSNAHIEVRWRGADLERMQQFAKELVASQCAAIAAIGREPGGGLVIASDVFMGIHRARVIECAARYRVPAVYPYRVIEGGLISYGPNISDFFLGPYVDRILKGAKPNELPVQVPTKVELVIDLRTAKTLGLDVPATLLVRADEVIE